MQVRKRLRAIFSIRSLVWLAPCVLLVLSTSSPLDVAASQAAAPQAAPGNAAVPPKVEVAPSIVSKPAPEYTDEGRAARIQGSVLVGAEIDEQGQVENVRLIRGLGFGLDKKAL